MLKKIADKISFIILLCSIGAATDALDFSEIKTFSDDNFLQMIVEIPAGTNKKFEYNPELQSFFVEKSDGVPRIIDFLPYPGNYGFIPSTLMDKKSGGDGDPLDVLLISESVSTGTVSKIIPIGLLVLEDNGELDIKIIATPSQKTLQIINVMTFSDLQKNYSDLMHIIEAWFLNYKGKGIVKFIRWDNELAALAEVNRWRQKE